MGFLLELSKIIYIKQCIKQFIQCPTVNVVYKILEKSALGMYTHNTNLKYSEKI